MTLEVPTNVKYTRKRSINSFHKSKPIEIPWNWAGLPQSFYHWFLSAGNVIYLQIRNKNKEIPIPGRNLWRKMKKGPLSRTPLWTTPQCVVTWEEYAAPFSSPLAWYESRIIGPEVRAKLATYCETFGQFQKSAQSEKREAKWAGARTETEAQTKRWCETCFLMDNCNTIWRRNHNSDFSFKY